MYKYNNTTAIYLLVIDTHILIHIFILLQRYSRYFLIVLHFAKYDYPVPSSDFTGEIKSTDHVFFLMW